MRERQRVGERKIEATVVYEDNSRGTIAVVATLWDDRTATFRPADKPDWDAIPWKEIVLPTDFFDD